MKYLTSQPAYVNTRLRSETVALNQEIFPVHFMLNLAVYSRHNRYWIGPATRPAVRHDLSDMPF